MKEDLFSGFRFSVIIVTNYGSNFPIKFAFYYCDPRSEVAVTCQRIRNM
jgi:hypothetical protein